MKTLRMAGLCGALAACVEGRPAPTGASNPPAGDGAAPGPSVGGLRSLVFVILLGGVALMLALFLLRRM